MKPILSLLVLLALATPAVAQVPDLRDLIPAGGSSVSGRMIQYIALLTILSVAPGLLIMVTSFTRIVIAFFISAIGSWIAEHAGQSRIGFTRSFPHFFHYVTGLRKGLERRTSTL